MKKIIIVSWFGTGSAGGVERVTRYMARVWGEKYDVEIADFESMKTRRLLKRLLGKHYVLDCIISSIYTNSRIRKNNRSDTIVITQGYNAPFVKADISYAHGTMRGFKVAVAGTKAKWKFDQLFEKRAHRRAQKVVAVSQKTEEELETYYGIKHEKINVIENCVNTDIFVPNYDRASDEKIVCLFCGRISRQKGIETVVRLADEIEKQPHMLLLIASPSPEAKDIFKKYKKIRILHAVDERQMHEFYCQGDVLIVPSKYEGFELVTAESLSSGVPVIGNRVGAIYTLYNKKTEGVYILEKNPIEIDKIKEIAIMYKNRDSKKRLHNMMVQNYSEKIYSEKLRALLDER